MDVIGKDSALQCHESTQAQFLFKLFKPRLLQFFYSYRSLRFGRVASVRASKSKAQFTYPLKHFILMQKNHSFGKQTKKRTETQGH